MTSPSGRPAPRSHVRLIVSVCTLLLALPTLAQNAPTPTAGAPGCGPADAKFEVTTDKNPNPVTKPDPGKALVYFLQDDTYFFTMPPRPTTLVGLDGQWIGATHANSYFYFSVDPGEHHLCTRWQGYISDWGRISAALHFTAEPGGVYFFRVQNISSPRRPTDVNLDLIDTDEGRLLASTFSFSISTTGWEQRLHPVSCRSGRRRNPTAL